MERWKCRNGAAEFQSLSPIRPPSSEKEMLPALQGDAYALPCFQVNASDAHIKCVGTDKMIIKKTTILLLTLQLLFFGCSSTKTTSKLKPDEAIAIALPRINADYSGSSTQSNEYTAFFKNNVWTISPKLPEGAIGGGPSAEVSDQKGIVIRTLFTE